jgi:hypothetical protein
VSNRHPSAPACRHELLDRTLILNRAHLLYAPRDYERHGRERRRETAALGHDRSSPSSGDRSARPLRPLPDPITDPSTLNGLGLRRTTASADSSTNTIMQRELHR